MYTVSLESSVHPHTPSPGKIWEQNRGPPSLTSFTTQMAVPFVIRNYITPRLLQHRQRKAKKLVLTQYRLNRDLLSEGFCHKPGAI